MGLIASLPAQLDSGEFYVELVVGKGQSWGRQIRSFLISGNKSSLSLIYFHKLPPPPSSSSSPLLFTLLVCLPQDVGSTPAACSTATISSPYVHDHNKKRMSQRTTTTDGRELVFREISHIINCTLTTTKRANRKIHWGCYDAMVNEASALLLHPNNMRRIPTDSQSGSNFFGSVRSS